MCISVQLLKHIYQGVSQSLRSNEGVLVIGAPAGGVRPAVSCIWSRWH